MAIERLIFSNLVENEEFARKTVPFLQGDYFKEYHEKLVFELIDQYIKKYNRSPTRETLLIDLDNREGVKENTYESAKELINSLKVDEKTDLQWAVDQCEEFCKDRAIYNALMSSITIIEDEESKLSRGAIPQILTDALSVSFDTSIGHDYISDWERRYDYYHRVENKVPFDVDVLNKITNGGLPNKTLTLLMAGPYVGKSLFMCHMAAGNLYAGKNVLYITMELSEELVSKRIDANLLEVPIDDIDKLPREVFERKIERVRGKTRGRLIVKEYPTAGAGAANFRHLLNELKIKKNFVPDVIYIDYINICTSSRLRHGANVNLYQYIKSVAEELRGLAIEFDVPIVSATQMNRSGFCLHPDTTVFEKSQGPKRIADVSIGDELQSVNGYNTVLKKFDTQKKRMYRIKTADGRNIICSSEHKFPTENGEATIANGMLKIGTKLLTMN